MGLLDQLPPNEPGPFFFRRVDPRGMSLLFDDELVS